MPEIRHVEGTIHCRSTTPGKQGSDIAKSKFDLIHKTLVDILSKAGPEGVPSRDMTEEINQRLTISDKASIGSVMWYFMAVKQEMEMRGEIADVPLKVPERIKLVT